MPLAERVVHGTPPARRAPPRGRRPSCTVEAGFPQPPLADTADDGQVEVDPGPSTEPLGTIAPGLHPMGFTHPIFVDVDDNGLYDPPETPWPE